MTVIQKRTWAFFSVLVAIILVGLAIIKLAQGYRPDFSTRSLMPTGLLVATSIPDGASIYIDGKLKSATNNTLDLTPGEYEIEIKKDGFSPWKKRLTIKKELVTKTDAYLFATYPDLKVLTVTGAEEPKLSPDSLKVAFRVASASASKKGVWVLDLTDRPLGLGREARQILQSAPKSRDFSLSDYEWSPDSQQLLVSLRKEIFLVDASKLNPATALIDISLEIEQTRKRWQAEENLKKEAELNRLPPELFKALTEKIDNISLSPDDTKILYTATASASIPEKIIPAVAAASTQKEFRQIEPGKVYVYDLKEDKNFYIADAPAVPSLKSQVPSSLPRAVSWYPTSKHIFIVQKDKISIREYDGTNNTDVYTGPFENSFAFPFPTGNRILVLTTIGKETPPNLYAITLR